MNDYLNDAFSMGYTPHGDAEQAAYEQWKQQNGKSDKPVEKVGNIFSGIREQIAAAKEQERLEREARASRSHVILERVVTIRVRGTQDRIEDLVEQTLALAGTKRCDCGCKQWHYAAVEIRDMEGHLCEPPRKAKPA